MSYRIWARQNRGFQGGFWSTAMELIGMFIIITFLVGIFL